MITLVIGGSGSGKSVLINMLRGIKEYAPDSGEVIFNIAMCENKDCLHVETPSKAGEKPLSIAIAEVNNAKIKICGTETEE